MGEWFECDDLFEQSKFQKCQREIRKYLSINVVNARVNSFIRSPFHIMKAANDGRGIVPRHLDSCIEYKQVNIVRHVAWILQHSMSEEKHGTRIVHCCECEERLEGKGGERRKFMNETVHGLIVRENAGMYSKNSCIRSISDETEVYTTLIRKHDQAGTSNVRKERAGKAVK